MPVQFGYRQYSLVYQSVLDPELDLTANPGGALPFTLTPALTKTTLLYSSTPLTYGTGAGLGVGPASRLEYAGQILFHRPVRQFRARQFLGDHERALRPGVVRVSSDGKSVFISDEYGPYVRQFDRATGQLIKTFTVPANLYVAQQFPQGAVETSTNTMGRTDNKGMEGLR